jgi:DNA-binding beta-propeller fold protein YncE
MSFTRARGSAASAAFAVAAGAALVVLCTGCTPGTSGARGPTAAAAASQGTGSAGPSATPAPVLPARSLPSPGCTTAVAASPALDSVDTAMVGVPGAFGVAVTPNGHWVFVAGTGSVQVLRAAGSLAPVPVRSIPVTPGEPLGETISPDGRYLLAADATGAVVLSVARAEQGASGAVLGTLATPAGARGGGAIEVAVSPDDRYAFVTLEDSQRAAVFNLAKALADGFGPADYVGSIPLELAPVGITVSPDGRWLYATSEDRTLPRAGGAAAEGGTLSVISLRRAETDPAASVVATVNAGCDPVRVITSADGNDVWVTARASDDLLCFAAARLATDPVKALVAITRVGEAPVGLAAVRGGSLVVVADSNRFGRPGASADLDVVNVADALSGWPAIDGHIGSGLFPRDMTVSPTGTLYVSNFSSGQLEAVHLASIPVTRR